MKKILMIVIAGVLLLLAGLIVYLKIVVDKEWRAGLYVPHTTIEASIADDCFQTDLQVIAVGEQYRELLKNGDYSVYLYDSYKDVEVASSIRYVIEGSNQYAQFVLHLSDQSSTLTKVEGIRIISKETVLLDKPIDMYVSCISPENERVKIDKGFATLSDMGFENEYSIINNSEIDISFQGIAWEYFEKENTKIQYINNVDIDAETIDMMNKETFEEESFTIPSGKEAIVIISYEDANLNGEVFWGTPVFMIDDEKYASNSNGVLTITEMSADKVLKLISEEG